MGDIATWGQLPTETEPAWQAFKSYRNAGVKRSLRKTACSIGKNKRLVEKWSSRHGWQARVASWDLEQYDLQREARTQAIEAAEERHGKLARALLGRVAAELGEQVKGRCKACGRSPVKLTGRQVASALKVGVEVERLALGQSTAAPNVTNVTNVSMSTTTTLVLLRDPQSQRLASELLGRMRSLDPVTSLRRLAGNQAAVALTQVENGNAPKPRGHAAKQAAVAQARANRAARCAAEGRPDVHRAAEDHEHAVREELRASRGAGPGRGRKGEAGRAPRAIEHVPVPRANPTDPSGPNRSAAEELGDDDDDLFPESNA